MSTTAPIPSAMASPLRPGERRPHPLRHHDVAGPERTGEQGQQHPGDIEPAAPRHPQPEQRHPPPASTTQTTSIRRREPATARASGPRNSIVTATPQGQPVQCLVEAPVHSGQHQPEPDGGNPVRSGPAPQRRAHWRGPGRSHRSPAGGTPRRPGRPAGRACWRSPPRTAPTRRAEHQHLRRHAGRAPHPVHRAIVAGRAGPRCAANRGHELRRREWRGPHSD